jgi:hypothetical protein
MNQGDGMSRGHSMNRWAITVLICAIWLTGAGTPAVAQWHNLPTPGIPRTADGKPNLTAPVPRTGDGKPDLSGLWQINGLGSATNITDTEMLPWAQQLYQQRLQTYGNDDPAVRCLPEGPRTGIAGLDPLRIVHTRNLLAILYETGQFRQIFTDGRPLPKDPNPTWMGYSVAHWDGDTLVVTTSGYNDKTWLDFNGHPHSEALQVTERFHRTDFGHMQLEMTFDDAKTYTKPFTLHATMSFLADDELLENVCLENEKDQTRLVGRIDDERKAEKKVAPAVLARYAGTYDVGPFGLWKVSVSGDHLTIELPDGGGKQAIFAQSNAVFVFQSTGGTVSFVTDPSGVASHLVLTIVEGEFKGARK